MQTETEMVWAAKQRLGTDRAAAIETLLTMAFHAKSQRVQNCAAEALLDIGVHVLGEMDQLQPNELGVTLR